MSRKSRYFLIARNRENNQYQILNITDTYGSSLEEIDCYTIDFENEKELLESLQKRGILEGNSYDFYIVHQTNEKKSKLYTQEVLYSEHHHIRKVSSASKDNHIEQAKDISQAIFYLFCSKMRHDQKFYDMVMYGKTSLYSKFKAYFADRRFLDSSHLQYRENGWYLQNYSIIRGMLEAFYRYEHDYSKEENDRELLEDELLIVTDKDYNPNQFSLFDDDLESILIQYNLLDKKEVDQKDGVCKRKSQ